MQKQWSWCRKCQGLFFLGHPSKGVCPHGGEHDSTGSGQYVVYDEGDGRRNAQSGWRWCHKCEGMVFSGRGAGRCPANDGHDTSRSGSYVALFEPNPGQMGWRWCQKCEGMYFAGASGAGLCPAGGEHDGASSGAYVVDFVAASIFEDFTGGWWIYSGLSAQSLGEKLVLHDAVIAALETDHNGGEQLFTAILKSNDGVAHWWYFGLTGSQVGERLTANMAVPVSLIGYMTSEGERFAVAMQKRAGVAYWWFFGLTADQLGAKLSELDAMPVDISACITPQGLRFAAILVPREGQDVDWYYGQNSADITRLLKSGGQLRQMRSYDTPAGHRYVITIVKPVKTAWWWFFGISVDDILRQARSAGSFANTISTYVEGGVRKYACIMLPRPITSTNPERHEKVRAMLSESHQGGWHGFYLRQISGSVIEAFNETENFDPCSSIKTLVHAHAMRAVQDRAQIAGQTVTLSTMIRVPDGMSTQCPFNDPNEAAHQRPMPLDQAMQLMMKYSVNTQTEAIRQFFGVAQVAATATALGMSETRHLGPTGCKTNEATLVDFGKLFEACSRTYLDAAHWQLFRQHAIDQPLDEVLNIVRSLASANGLPADFVDRYGLRMLSVRKGGSGNDGTIEKKSLVGYVALPFCHGERIIQRDYVYGVFLDYTPVGTVTPLEFRVVVAEMLHDEIAASVQSFARGGCAL